MARLILLLACAFAAVAATPSQDISKLIIAQVSPFLTNQDAEKLAKALATQACQGQDIGTMLSNFQKTLLNSISDKARLLTLTTTLTNTNKCLKAIDKNADLFSTISQMKPAIAKNLGTMYNKATAVMKGKPCAQDATIQAGIKAAIPELNDNNMYGIFVGSINIVGKPKLACCKTNAAKVFNFKLLKV